MSNTGRSTRSVAQNAKRREREVEGGAGGALAGAAGGAVAGPAGAAVGAVIGAIAGALTGAAMADEAASNVLEDRRLDDEIGVTTGEIGAPNLAHPPAQVGAYSGESAGAGSVATEEEPAEGPMQPPE